MQLVDHAQSYDCSAFSQDAILDEDVQGVSPEHARKLRLFSQATVTHDFRPLAEIGARELKQFVRLYGHLAFERRFARAMLAEQARRAQRGKGLRRVLEGIAVFLRGRGA